MDCRSCQISCGYDGAASASTTYHELRPGRGTGDGSGRPHQLWYRYAGREIGTLGNDGGGEAGDLDYAGSDALRETAPGSGPFADGAGSGTPYARFGASPDPVNSYAQGSAAGTYTARAGDTLSSIAAQLWGDASLWYKLAQANPVLSGAEGGLTSDGGLTAGETLRIPAGVIPARMIRLDRPTPIKHPIYCANRISLVRGAEI